MHPSPATGPRYERRQRIHFSHCDPAGLVFFPQYYVLFNDLIEDWVTDGLGISYAQLLGSRRIGLPTVNIQSDFRAVSRMGDDVSLGVRIERLGTRSFTLAHKAIALPDDLRAAMESFQQTALVA